MGIEVLLGPDNSQSLIASTVVAGEIVAAAGLAVHSKISSEELRRALRTVLISLHVYR